MYKSVQYNEVGVMRNSLSKSLDKETIYYAGRYYTGLLNSFLTYERAIQYIEFSDLSDAQSVCRLI